MCMEDTFASAIGMDNLEATLQRIALGVFGGFGNGDTSGGVAGFSRYGNGNTNGGLDRVLVDNLL
ncbi:hypothetical protein ACP70R_035552 [Stipagrostis hirtigluma subsp. patula]